MRLACLCLLLLPGVTLAQNAPAEFGSDRAFGLIHSRGRSRGGINTHGNPSPAEQKRIAAIVASISKATDKAGKGFTAGYVAAATDGGIQLVFFTTDRKQLMAKILPYTAKTTVQKDGKNARVKAGMIVQVKTKNHRLSTVEIVQEDATK